MKKVICLMLAAMLLISGVAAHAEAPQEEKAELRDGLAWGEQLGIYDTFGL